MTRPALARAVRGIAVCALTLLVACGTDEAPPLPAADATMPSGPEATAVTTAPGDATAPPTDAPTAPGDATAPPTDAPTEATNVAPTTSTLPPLVTRRAVVLVANAANVPGAAGRLTQALEQAGFETNEATNAAGWEIRLRRSKIYYLPEAEAAARSLAERMGVKIFPMPVPVPITGAYEFFGDTTIVVMLGRDLADQPIPGITS